MVWRELLLSCASGDVAGAMGTAISSSWWCAHRKGRRILRVAVVAGTPAFLDLSKRAAASLTVRKVSTAVGLVRGSSAVAINGGMEMELVKNVGVMFASCAVSTSMVVVTFLRVSQFGTSMVLGVKRALGLNLREGGQVCQPRVR